VKNNIHWLNLLKVRYSWGKVGNDQLKIGDNNERFPYLYTIDEIWRRDENGNLILENGQKIPTGGYQWADYGLDRYYGGIRYSQVASPHVTWEMATKNNLGVDIALLRDKFIANLDFFDEKRTGIY